MEGKKFIQVQVTFPDEVSARDFARSLIEFGNAACVQIIPIDSIYRWDGKINEEREVLVMIKTVMENFGSIESKVLKDHPYDVPEIISFVVDQGSKDYLRWIGDMCRKK